MHKLSLILALIGLMSSSATFALENEKGRFAVKGGIGKASVTWLGPLRISNFKLGIGGEYWFNQNWALGADIGLGGEGYGKIIGTTSLSMLNLKTGDTIVNPGISGTYALSPLGHFTLYSGLRVGFPMRTGLGAAFSIAPSLGALVAINDWAALDLSLGANVVANFRLSYLATTLSLGSVGFRIFI